MMKVILTEEVPSLGAPGRVVEVATGYARNYLLPRKLAVQATTGNVKQLEHHRRTIEARQKKLAQGAEAVGARISAVPITIAVRAGEAGRLYGSITSADIAAELKRAFDMEVDKRKIEIPEPIKVLGEHTVKVQLHRDVQVLLPVVVVAEAAPAKPEERADEASAPASAPVAPGADAPAEAHEEPGADEPPPAGAPEAAAA
jgi:large subunit ribosomal protein L9